MSHDENEDQYKNICSKMKQECRYQIASTYNGYGKYYTKICNEMAGKLFNWLFILNTGGFSVSLHTYNSNKSLTSIFYLLVIFGFGILFTYLSVVFEQRKFDKKGAKLENRYKDFQSDKIIGSQFLDDLPPKLGCLDKVPEVLEKIGFGLFVLGTIIGICLMQ